MLLMFVGKKKNPITYSLFVLKRLYCWHRNNCRHQPSRKFQYKWNLQGCALLASPSCWTWSLPPKRSKLRRGASIRIYCPRLCYRQSFIIDALIIHYNRLCISLSLSLSKFFAMFHSAICKSDSCGHIPYAERCNIVTFAFVSKIKHFF